MLFIIVILVKWVWVKLRNTDRKRFLALIDIVRKRVGLRFRKSFKVL